MLNIVIPMAGRGKRFADAGFDLPKPLIPVRGVPMIEAVVANIRPASPHRFIFVCQQEHLERADVKARLRSIAPGCEIVPVHGITEGAACTILHARKLIDDDAALLLANSDQLIDVAIEDFYADCLRRHLDGSIMTFRDPARDPKWSFAKTDTDGRVVEVREKQPISEHATVGIYLFRRGGDFVDGAIDMIARNDRVNAEFYACPVYNYLIGDGKNIGIHEIPGECMHGLGTPDDLAAYLAATDPLRVPPPRTRA
jgi:dTDP-glucose pyrophosphorylase